MFLRADDITKDTVLNADICIIGAGAAGITMALELNNSPLSVTILESGDFKHDDITQSLHDLTTTHLSLSEPSRIRQFGGTTTVWAGRMSPHTRIDFETRSWVPHSGWPIDYEELIPHYRRASLLLDASAFDSFTTKDVAHLVKKSTHSLLQNQAFEAPVFHWFKHEDWDWGKKHKETLKQSKNISVILRANAVNIASHETGTKAEYVEVKTVFGNQFRVHAQAVVLAAGGIENARLLLQSNHTHKTGLGNEHDQVGRYYMDHPKGVVGEVEPYSKKTFLPAYWGTTEQDGLSRVGIALTPETQRREKILNSYVLLEPVFPWSYNPGLSALIKLAQVIKRRKIPGDIITQYAGTLFKNQKAVFGWMLSKAFARSLNRQARVQNITIWNFMEQIPHPDNRVRLGTERDILGNNKAQLSWSIHEQDKHTMGVFHRILQEQLRAYRIGELKSPLLERGQHKQEEWLINKDSSHHMGTTRMGNDPRTSVVDKNCRLHIQENIYLAGSSVFPTGGYANPTYTISALAVRLAQYLKKNYRSQYPPAIATMRESDHSDRKKHVLIIGAGGRVRSAILPALACLEDRFTITDIISKTVQKISLNNGRKQWTTHSSYDLIDFSHIDVIMIVVPTGAVPDVLKKLAEHNTKHCILMLDTPVVPLSKPWTLKLTHQFKDVRVSEDTIALPPFVLARKLIDEGKIGKLKRIHFIYNGYRYHALASLKYLTQSSVIKKITMHHLREGKRRRELVFAGGVRATIYEPRDYAKGKFRIDGTVGCIADYDVQGKQCFQIGYQTNDAGIYQGLTFNNEPVAQNSIDELYYANIKIDTQENALMDSMKIRGLIDLLNDVYEGTNQHRYPALEGYYDLLAVSMSEKFKRFYDILLLGKHNSLWKVIIRIFS